MPAHSGRMGPAVLQGGTCVEPRAWYLVDDTLWSCELILIAEFLQSTQTTTIISSIISKADLVLRGL